jgi:hypothetical protein
MRSVPLTYRELASAIQAGVYPRERTWIDFKRRLYPEGDDAADGAAREKVSQELARDMASMAELGGFLVYGVKEDKAKHTFSVDEMSLPVGLHETVDAVARDRITPTLTVVPTLVPNPENGTTGFLVVEIPESPDSPHMTDFTYWGRSETGKVRLSDDRVEQLILARARRSERLSQEMQATLDVDPITGDRQEVSHFYFTAVPTRSWPDMHSQYTSDPQSRMRLLQRCSNLAYDLRRADGDQRPAIAYAALSTHRRTQRVAAGWVQTWPGKPGEGPGYRTVGVDDDGPIRYINLGAASAHNIDPDTKLVHEAQLLHETMDMIRLVTALSDDAGYVGGWLLGIQLNRLSGHVSQLADPFVGGRQAPAVPFDAPGYSASTRASALELRDKLQVITGRLMRKLLRGRGTEWLLSQPPFDQG